jgi:hypothetical protein
MGVRASGGVRVTTLTGGKMARRVHARALSERPEPGRHRTLGNRDRVSRRLSAGVREGDLYAAATPASAVMRTSGICTIELWTVQCSTTAIKRS